MGDATHLDAKNSTSGKTIRPDEAAHFGNLAADWWDPKGASAMLHRFNPVRLGFIRDTIDAHWNTDSDNLTPLSGKSALDVGCGAGLLCEPLARLGADVTGIDAAAQNIAAASAHAEGSGLVIDYRAGELSEMGLGQYDLVTALEVIEHVADKGAFITALAAHLAPGGLMVLSTPNRTPQSRILLVGAAEAVGMIPKGTHHWDDFITPDALCALLADNNLAMAAPAGITFSPARGLHLSENLALNYIVSAQHA